MYPKAPEKVSWGTAVEALKDALKKEAEVTASIRSVISVCSDDGFNDFHVSFLNINYRQFLKCQSYINVFPYFPFIYSCTVCRLLDWRLPGGAVRRSARPCRKDLHFGQDDAQPRSHWRIFVRQKVVNSSYKIYKKYTNTQIPEPIYPFCNEQHIQPEIYSQWTNTQKYNCSTVGYCIYVKHYK